MSVSNELGLIMYRHTDGEMRMWACRGVGKGCNRNKYRGSKKPCDDCIGPLEESLTLEQVQAMIKQGDA